MLSDKKKKSEKWHTNITNFRLGQSTSCAHLKKDKFKTEDILILPLYVAT